MSSKKYATPLRLELKPSRVLFLVLLVLHLAALALTYYLFSNVFLLLFIAALLIFSGYFVLAGAALKKTSSAVVKLVWDANNEWILETKVGETLNAELMRDSYINSFITVLIFKCEGRMLNTHVVLLKDNVDVNTFRRLRVRLKVGNAIEMDSR